MRAEYEIREFDHLATVLETKCVGSCPQLYRIDDRHPDYARIKTALDLGDRSVIFCYHRFLLTGVGGTELLTPPKKS